MFIEILTTFITLAVVIYNLMTWNFNYWKDRGIPYTKGTFPFGNVGDVLFNKKTFSELYEEIYWKFESFPVCGFFKIRQPVLLIRDIDLVKKVLVSEFHNFHDNDFDFNPKTDPVLVYNPFVATGNKWKETRGVLGASQTPAKLKHIIPCTVGVCRNMVEFFNDNRGREIQVTEIMEHFTTDFAAAWGLGVQVNSFKDPTSDFRRNAKIAFGGDFSSNLAIQLAFYAPFLGKILGFRMIRKAFEDYFKGVVLDVLEKRREESIQRVDLIQMLLDMNKEAKLKGKGQEMDLNEITGHILTFLSEIQLTSSLSLSYIFFELAQHPDIQETARKEINKVVSSIDELEFDKIQKMHYIDNIIDETLRMHTVVPVMTRLCTKSTTMDLGSGKTLDVEEGTPVAIPLQAFHMDPKYYPNPEKFDPDRFSDQNIKSLKNSTLYLGFGAGPRACVGINLARATLKIVISAVLLKYEVLPSTKTSKVEPDRLSTFLIMPKNGIWLKFEPL